jgi:hypothetical protein
MVIGLTALNSFVYGISFNYTFNQTLFLTFSATVGIVALIFTFAFFQKNIDKRKARIK